MHPILRSIANQLLAVPGLTVDPHALNGKQLPHVFILQVQETEAGHRLLVRLAGTALDALFDRPLTGRFLDEFMHGPRSADVLSAFDRCATTREPLWMRQVVRIRAKTPRFVEGIAIFGGVDRIYGALVSGEAGTSSATHFECQRLTVAANEVGLVGS